MAVQSSSSTSAVGGVAPSLAGYADGTRPDLSLVQQLHTHARDLQGLDAPSLLHELQSKGRNGRGKKYPGASGLITKRVLTYLEGVRAI